MALFGRDTNRGSFFGARLNLDSRNWTKANTETNDYNDRAKWAPRPHPLAREPKLREMQDHPSRAQKRADEELDQQMHNLGAGWDAAAQNEGPVPSGGLADRRQAEMIGLQVDAKRGAAEMRRKKAHTRMVEEFDNWLRGK